MAETVSRRGLRPLSIADRPIYAMLIPIPVVCFLGAVWTDICYVESGGNLLWVDFSSWLIAAGMLFGALAGLALLIDSIRLRRGWSAFGFLLAAWIAELINSFVHARDGWTAVVPLGLILSIVAALLVLLSGWFAASVRVSIAGERS